MTMCMMSLAAIRWLTARHLGTVRGHCFGTYSVHYKLSKLTVGLAQIIDVLGTPRSLVSHSTDLLTQLQAALWAAQPVNKTFTFTLIPKANDQFNP